MIVDDAPMDVDAAEPAEPGQAAAEPEQAAAEPEQAAPAIDGDDDADDEADADADDDDDADADDATGPSGPLELAPRPVGVSDAPVEAAEELVIEWADVAPVRPSKERKRKKKGKVHVVFL